MKPRIIFGLVALSVIWGSTWMAIRVLVVLVPPMHSASLRFLLASVILLPIIQWKRLPWPTGRGLRAAMLLSLTMIAVPSALNILVGAAPFFRPDCVDLRRHASDDGVSDPVDGWPHRAANGHGRR